MIEVTVKDNTFESFDRAVKKFKKEVNNSGVIKELQDRRYFRTTSQKIRDKKLQAERRRNHGGD